jgi:Alw26I/Eco31I/Esp3I family type II restriction m6 adenine DNA methyltransferase
VLENEIFDGLIAGMQSSPERAQSILEEVVSIPELLASEEVFENTTRQRENGIFYTNFRLARLMVAEAFEKSKNPTGSFFEPCVGGGAFYFAFIDQSMKATGGKESDLREILERCYIADNDAIALATLKRVAPIYFKAQYGYELDIPESNIFLGDSLWSSEESSIQNFRKIFNEPKGFDFVITNPPYRMIKGDKRQGETSTNSLIETISQIRSSKSLKFIQGVPNLYKLFVEAITCHWVSEKGTVGLLIPKSLLSDSQSSDLREHLLENFELGSIFGIPEGSEHFKGVGQAFSMFVATKGPSTSSVVFADIPDSEEMPIVRSEPLDIGIIRKYSTKSALHRVSDEGQKLLTHLADFPTVGSFPGVVNLRGEFDMTLDIGFLSESDTGLSLIQGINLGHYSTTLSRKFVDTSFLNRPKGKWIKQHRIACQQISNMNQVRRMKWSLIQPGSVLGNSCNFVGIESDGLWAVSEETIFYFLGILNSSLVNERFKLLSPNNHVSNGEVNSLPIGDLHAPEVEEIIKLSQKLSREFDEKLFEELDTLVLNHFGLAEEDRYWEATK